MFYECLGWEIRICFLLWSLGSFRWNVLICLEHITLLSDCNGILYFAGIRCNSASSSATVWIFAMIAFVSNNHWPFAQGFWFGYQTFIRVILISIWPLLILYSIQYISELTELTNLVLFNYQHQTRFALSLPSFHP